MHEDVTPCSTPTHHNADLSLNSIVRCPLRKSAGQGQVISFYKGRYQIFVSSMVSTFTVNAAIIVGNCRKQRVNDPYDCYQIRLHLQNSQWPGFGHLLYFADY